MPEAAVNKTPVADDIAYKYLIQTVYIFVFFACTIIFAGQLKQTVIILYVSER